MGFTQTTILGNLGRDPEMSYTTGGTAVTKFSVAVTDKVKRNGQDTEVTTWYNCSAFRGLAEMLNTHLKKGATVLVQGKLAPRIYTTKQGQPALSLDLTVDNFSFAGGSKPNQGAGHETDEVPF